MDDRHDAIYKALADEHRRAILARLCRGPRVAGELAELVGLAPSALSFHLKCLESAGLVSVHREGRFLRYRAEPRGLEAWKDHVADVFRSAPVRVSAPVRPTTGSASRRPELPSIERADEPLPIELL